ncbi:PA0069 family radical SAM protein [Phreatobacter aquaticus]|uniref:PA0069 family radical SAM protein n=1 Tax=Phreatobacter aquaticus TaxID=2570229 RepID=A0A4D7QKS6_9HYPH|nr:PA0069 family radical SAM protein [Phreatobacter aquaticus]QCK88238.1 PA0069 family radical SAM protein [Phreatobacter aquaticus]
MGRIARQLDSSLADRLNAGGLEAAAAELFGTKTAHALDLSSGPGVDEKRRRGRGTLTNASGRFEKQSREGFDDGWNSLDELPAFATTVTEEKAKRIITRNESPDLSFDRSINPYRGCEHGCTYCFARPSHAYMGLSPGLDFETKLFAKPNAPELLEKELAEAGYQPRTIALGTNTDPYQPIEKQWGLTRRILEVLERANHPVGIVTKNHLVTRDIDILARMAEKGLAKVALSVTTLDRKLARSMEPRASTPPKRLEAIRMLSEAGIPTAVLVAPIIPAVNDAEIERILDACWHMGAREAGYVLLRLPLEIRDLFREWLVANKPDAARHVLSLVQGTRGGKDYDSAYGVRQKGTGPFAWMIGRRFEMAMERIGYGKRRLRLTTDLFTPPARKGKAPAEQLNLF